METLETVSPPGPEQDELQELASLLLKNNGVCLTPEEQQSAVEIACQLQLLSLCVENDVPRTQATTL